MNKIILLGEPKSTSHIYKFTCRGRFASAYMSAQGKAIKESYILQARTQWKKPLLTGNLAMFTFIYFGTKRKSDYDNFSKLCNDSLTGIVFEDDSQITKAYIEKRYDKENPRIELVVVPIELCTPEFLTNTLVGV